MSTLLIKFSDLREIEFGIKGQFKIGIAFQHFL